MKIKAAAFIIGLASVPGATAQVVCWFDLDCAAVSLPQKWCDGELLHELQKQGIQVTCYESVLESYEPFTCECTTDTDCADKCGGNGDPDPADTDPRRFDDDACAETDEGCLGDIWCDSAQRWTTEEVCEEVSP
ncbi:MAG: hypothetical protein ACREBU_02465 [Nitrososphaera sp.]